MPRYKALFSLSAIIASLSLPAYAELASRMSAHLVVSGANGVETFAPAKAAKPGDLIEYHLIHTNTFSHSIGGIAIIGPVPDGTVLVDSYTDMGAPGIFEVRGAFDPDTPGEDWSTLPATKIVVKANGERVYQPATPEDFTAVRWRLTNPLSQNATVHHRYRTRVE